MTASAPYLSFNATFTPACMGWARGTDGAVQSKDKSRKPEKSDMQLVYYSGVARGNCILVDFGKHRKVLSHVLSGVLTHVPPHVSRYSLGYGRTVALFLISDGYTYFFVADEALGRPRGFQNLSQVRSAFLECLGGGGGQSNPSSVSNSFETETSWSSLGAKGESATKNQGSKDDGDIQLLRRPSIPRSRSASQLTTLMSEAMESRFEEIVSKCRGRLHPKPKLETYPDAPDAYLTSKKSVYEPDLLEEEASGEEAGSDGAGAPSTLSARESLMSEIEEMLKEVDSPRVRCRSAEERAEMEAEEEEEDEHIPGMDLLMGMVGGDKWFSVAGSAAWDPPGSRSSQGMYSTARFHHPREVESADSQAIPVRPSSGILQPVTIFDDAEGEAAAVAAENAEGEGPGTGGRVQKAQSLAEGSAGGAGEESGGLMAGRARQRLKMSAFDKTSRKGGANLPGRRVPPILRGALNSVFLRTSTGTRLSANSLSRGNGGETGAPRSPPGGGLGGLSSVAETQSPRGTPGNEGGGEEGKGSPLPGPSHSLRGSHDGSGRLAPLLTSFMRRGDPEGLGGVGAHSGRSWRISATISRPKSSRSDGPASTT